MPRSVLLGPLDLLPVCPDLVDIFDPKPAKHVRMAANQLFRDVAGDLVEVESLALMGQLAVKHHLQQQITQLFFQFVVIASLNRIDQFIDLFDRMPAQRHMVLLLIPGTTPG